MESSIPTFLVTCLVASALLTGTSLILVNAVGKSLYRRENGTYIFKTEQAQNLRDKVDRYPNLVFCTYLAVALSLVGMAACNEFGRWEVCDKIDFPMVVLSASYFTWILLKMRSCCSGVFDALSQIK